jgi:hypothetical protein
LIGHADEQAKYYKSGNPDKSVDQTCILLSEPQSLDASSLRAAMQQVCGLKTRLNAIADGPAR